MTQAESPAASPAASMMADLRAVDELCAAYARILEHVWSMKRFDRMSVAYATLESDANTKWVKRPGWPGLLLLPLRLIFWPVRGWWRSSALRPVLSLYTETHIHTSVSKLSGVLTRERLKANQGDGPETESLERSIARLERLKTTTTGWVTLMIVLRFVPLFGLLFSMGIVTVSFTLNDAPGLILQLIAILPLTVLLIHPLAVQFGFRWKRALFAGGGNASIEVDSVEVQVGLPTANTYDLEQRTYKKMGLKRSGELPVDLLLAPGFYFLLEPLIGFAFGTFNFTEETDSPGEVIAGTIVAFMFFAFFLMSAIRLGLRYRLRRASRFM
jgi:hypothetical protein